MVYIPYSWKLGRKRLMLWVEFDNREIRIIKSNTSKSLKDEFEKRFLLLSGTVKGSEARAYSNGDVGFVFGDEATFNDTLRFLKIERE